MILLTIVLLALVGLLAYAATRPDDFRYARTIRIEAPPEKVFALVDDLHAWAGWSPWEKLDPAMKRTYAGPQKGVGASYAWDGEKKVGAGRMEIVRSEAPSRIGLSLDFERPFEAHNACEFTLAISEGKTVVTWAMTGKNPFFSKLVGLFVDMDAMIGKDFETGLANLKALAER